ncbi:MAG: hypothetical protein JKY50_19465 [Oleispira sp.]|nr:hypothetical protein [Oleispira sp.]
MSGETEITVGEVKHRLSSIENKLDRIIRVEERQNNHTDDLKRVFVRVEKVEDRVRQLEITAGEASVRTSGNSGAITVFVSALASIAVGIIVWNLRG